MDGGVTDISPGALSRLEMKMDNLEVAMRALKLVLRAMIESHPDPKKLVNRWRTVSHDDMERARPKKGHIGFPAKEEMYYAELRAWDNLIHDIEAAPRSFEA